MASSKYPLHTACASGHRYETCRQLLSNGANVNETNEIGDTPLHIACRTTNSSIVTLLLRYKARCGVKNKTGMVPLHEACLGGSMHIVSKLINKGVKISPESVAGMTPLHLACGQGYLDIVKKILENTDKIHIKTKAGETVLHWASAKGHKEIVETLIEHRIDINAKTIEEETALHWACSGGHNSVVSTLLEKGALVNSSNKSQTTPLLIACKLGAADIVSTLIDKGADIQAVNEKGMSPLHIACSINNSNIVSLLLKEGAYIQAADNSGDTPLHVACKGPGLNVIKMLLKCKAKINETNKLGNSPLHVASYEGQSDIAEFLLDRGADIHAENSNKDTCLHRACEMGQTQTVNMLIDKKCKVNVPNSLGETPLHLACKNGDKHIIHALIDHGSFIYYKDKYGKTCLDHVLESQQHEIVTLLLNKSQQLNATVKINNEYLINMLYENMSHQKINNQTDELKKKESRKKFLHAALKRKQSLENDPLSPKKPKPLPHDEATNNPINESNSEFRVINVDQSSCSDTAEVRRLKQLLLEKELEIIHLKNEKTTQNNQHVRHNSIPTGQETAELKIDIINIRHELKKQKSLFLARFEDIEHTLIQNNNAMITKVKLEAGTAGKCELDIKNPILRKNMEIITTQLSPDNVLVEELRNSHVLTDDQSSQVKHDITRTGKIKRILMAMDNCNITAANEKLCAFIKALFKSEDCVNRKIGETLEQDREEGKKTAEDQDNETDITICDTTDDPITQPRIQIKQETDGADIQVEETEATIGYTTEDNIPQIKLEVH